MPPSAPAHARSPRLDRDGAATRTAALWVPDWPVVAAMVAGQVDAHRPAAVHDGRTVTAVSASARAQGVRRGMRRRQAQECCPGLELLAGDEGRDARSFEPVAAAAETVVAGLEIARPGLLLLPATGASRYHGSEEALAERLVAQVAEATGHECQVGIADGLLAAVLAARSARVIPPGTARAFLAPHAVAELVHAAIGEQAVAEVSALVDLLVRLGLHTLGDLTALPAADVDARFGDGGTWAHRLARGEDVRPPARRRLEPDVAVECELDPPAERVDAAAFAARRLAEQLQAMLVERSSSCGRLRITARTESGEELVRTWRTDAGGLGGLSAARITDRVRWQLEGWLSGSADPRRASGGARAERTPAPSALTRLGIAAEEVAPAGAEQGRLWGGASGGDLRAHRALLRVQGLLGGDGVLVATLQGGRDVRDQVHLVPWGDARTVRRAADRPWPGRLPEPAPATVLVEPVGVDVLDAEGCPVVVDARLAMSAPPATVRWPHDGSDRPAGRPSDRPADRPTDRPADRPTDRPAGRPTGRPAVPGTAAGSYRLVAWAGPWPMVERWWTAAPRRRVHLQVALEGGRALLLSCSQGEWLCEAVYD